MSDGQERASRTSTALSATGGWAPPTDLIVQRFVDAWLSFPGLLLLLTILSTFGRGVLQIIVILGISAGIGNARVVRKRAASAAR